LAVVFALGSLFGYSTLGPFTKLERVKAFEAYQSQVEATMVQQLQRVSSFTKDHTVGYDSLVFKNVDYTGTSFKSYNMVLEVKGNVVAEYEIHLVDGTLMCTSTLSSYAVFFKDHDEIRVSSFSLEPAGDSTSECKFSAFKPAGQNH